MRSREIVEAFPVSKLLINVFRWGLEDAEAPAFCLRAETRHRLFTCESLVMAEELGNPAGSQRQDGSAGDLDHDVTL